MQLFAAFFESRGGPPPRFSMPRAAERADSRRDVPISEFDRSLTQAAKDRLKYQL